MGLRDNCTTGDDNTLLIIRQTIEETRMENREKPLLRHLFNLSVGKSNLSGGWMLIAVFLLKTEIQTFLHGS